MVSPKSNDECKKKEIYSKLKWMWILNKGHYSKEKVGWKNLAHDTIKAQKGCINN